MTRLDYGYTHYTIPIIVISLDLKRKDAHV
jgi:hypothetical protein